MLFHEVVHLHPVLLSFLVGLNARVCEIAVAVDGEDNAVMQKFHGIRVESVAVDGMCLAVRRIVCLFEAYGVVGMDGLIYYRVVIEMLHDVYLASVGPLDVLIGQHPDGWPCSLCSSKLALTSTFPYFTVRLCLV